MGNYTAFRCKALIKPEYHALVQAILDANANQTPKFTCGSTSPWLRLPELAQTYPFLQELADCDRGGSILSWMSAGDWKEEWIEDDEEWRLSFKDDLLVFQSAIKNYDQEYQKFVKVFDIIAERIDYCARWYEENYGPQKYVDGVWLDPPKEPGPHDSWLWHEDQ